MLLTVGHDLVDALAVADEPDRRDSEGSIMSPFRSKAQRRFLYAKHPKLAKKWSARYGSKIRKKSR